MENITELEPLTYNSKQEDSIFESHKLETEPGVSTSNIKRIELLGNRISIKDEPMTKREFHELAGAYFQGTQYYDFRNVHYVNNTGLANLIDLLKSMLVQGIEVKFVNVNPEVKEKIKAMGMEKVFNCS